MSGRGHKKKINWFEAACVAFVGFSVTYFFVFLGAQSRVGHLVVASGGACLWVWIDNRL